MPAALARRDQHGHGLRGGGGKTRARIEQVAVAPAADLEVAVVVARGADRLAVTQLQRRQRRATNGNCGRGCWMPMRQGVPAPSRLPRP
jgi:hypothetical protein